MNPNSERFDLSNRLIHFFRPLDLESDDSPGGPEEWGAGGIVEDTLLSPFFLLRNAVRLGRIWATWSFRKGRRTIYGPHPAVCFTEMPLGAFIEAGEGRQAKGEAMSPYALVFPKAPLHARGARPVIYGLSESPYIPNGQGGGERLIPDDALPRLEQYRYVTHAPDARIDWTHEREWRWPFRGSLPYSEDGISHGSEIPGFEIDQQNFDGIGAVVKTVEQAHRLIYDILTITDREPSGFCQYEFVVARENINDLSALRDPQYSEGLIASSSFSLREFFNLPRMRISELVANYMSLMRSVSASPPPAHAYAHETGGCWLWLTDNRQPLVRALLAENLAHVNQDGRYLVDLPEFDIKFSLRQREEMTKILANLLQQNAGVSATYHSVLNSHDPNGVPHYSDPPLDNNFHFNYAHRTQDF
ncbi:DUF4427 domain-containing protein [Magnetospirillum sp. 64-120]|uniref:DUF4427 domain-containing protein n=1 Tax=Magnetospirillum sp. 64-120 TaxID=1895778 RepID=UPI000A6B0C2E|nr:DUF4427 domain-containing protein [Magnetospirillum sp. 64-120]